MSESETQVIQYPNLQGGVGHRWRPGESGNPNGRPPTSRALINGLIEVAARDGKVEEAVNEYFELMLHARDPRLRFDVLRDFFDRIGLPKMTDGQGNPRAVAQIVNVIRGNSPDLNV